MSNRVTGRTLSRRIVLAGIATAGASVGCIGSENSVPQTQLRPYWEPALEVAAGAIDVLRTIAINTGAFARGGLTLDRYLRSVESQRRPITDLAELIIPLHPPSDASAPHEALASAIDALVGIGPTVLKYRNSEQPEHLIHLIAVQDEVRAGLTLFIDGIGPGLAHSGLRNRLSAIGESDIVIWRMPTHAVLVGPFDDEAAARATLAHMLDEEIRLSPTSIGWVEVGRFTDRAIADEAAREWLIKDFQVRIKDTIDLAFDVTTIRPPVRQSWRELDWLAPLAFDAIDLAASDMGEQVIAVSRAGKVASFDEDGSLKWTRDMRMPLAYVSMQQHGEFSAVHGFEIQILDTNGNPVWPTAFRPDNQLLEQAIFNESGRRLVVRSTNASGLGRVFSFDHTGRIWGPTKDYIAAAKVAFHSPTGTVAVGSSKLGENQVVLIQSNGHFLQRFGVDGDIIELVFTVSGDRVAVLTNEGVSVFECATANPRGSIPFPAKHVVRAPHDDVLFLAGDAGIGSFTIDGFEIWTAPTVRARTLYPMASYIGAHVDDLTITVIRNDGVILGNATTLATIHAIAVAPDRDRIFAVSAERQIQAWQMPSATEAPEG